MSLLAFDGVACARGGRTLFEGVSFALEPGDAMLVTGPNGAGKSSLIRIAAGLLHPAAGAVRGEGRRALSAEQAALDDERPLAAALAFWARLDRTDAAVAVSEALVALDLDSLAHVPVRLLSTGQRRRAAFARVLASGAALWLLDEPANGLDPAAAARLEQVIARHRDTGGAVLVASHTAVTMPDALSLQLGHSGERQTPFPSPTQPDPGFCRDDGS